MKRNLNQRESEDKKEEISCSVITEEPNRKKYKLLCYASKDSANEKP